MPTLYSYWTVNQQIRNRKLVNRGESYAGRKTGRWRLLPGVAVDNATFRSPTNTPRHRRVRSQSGWMKRSCRTSRLNMNSWSGSTILRQQTMSQLTPRTSTPIATKHNSTITTRRYSRGQTRTAASIRRASTTNVPRTVGWHNLTVTVGSDSITLAIDGKAAFTASGNYSYDSVTLSQSGPGIGAQIHTRTGIISPRMFGSRKNR